MNTHNDASKAPAAGRVFAFGLDTLLSTFCPDSNIQSLQICRFARFSGLLGKSSGMNFTLMAFEVGYLKVGRGWWRHLGVDLLQETAGHPFRHQCRVRRNGMHTGGYSVVHSTGGEGLVAVTASPVREYSRGPVESLQL